MRIGIVAALLIALGGLAAAQHQHGQGLAQRTIKALSDQQLWDLRVGRGMGLALAAELNGYPGVGETLITHETALDRAFAERSISPSTLALLTAQIGETQGRLRAIHLKYHLTTAELLSADQRHRYAELRGYH